MTEQGSRGREAWSQAYEYIAGNNPGERPRQLRRMAWQYLLLTASPPLTPAELKAARRARRTPRRRQARATAS